MGTVWKHVDSWEIKAFRRFSRKTSARGRPDIGHLNRCVYSGLLIAFKGDAVRPTHTLRCAVCDKGSGCPDPRVEPRMVTVIHLVMCVSALRFLCVCV